MALATLWSYKYRVGDLSPDISIIGQLYYTIKMPLYLEFCIKRLVVIVNLVYKISAKIFKVCSHNSTKRLLTKTLRSPVIGIP